MAFEQSRVFLWYLWPQVWHPSNLIGNLLRKFRSLSYVCWSPVPGWVRVSTLPVLLLVNLRATFLSRPPPLYRVNVDSVREGPCWKQCCPCVDSSWTISWFPWVESSSHLFCLVLKLRNNIIVFYSSLTSSRYLVEACVLTVRRASNWSAFVTKFWQIWHHEYFSDVIASGKIRCERW